MELESCDIERRSDGVLLVRVHSSARNGRPLPDAVFTFRQGDPQYEYWNHISLQKQAQTSQTSPPSGESV